MIFQVRADTVYLIDDHNKVILPDQGGAFDNLELLGGGHYEVYGESTNDGEPEFESSLPTIKAKVFEALGQEQSIVLIDSHHNEIMDCEGTRGPGFWKQNARKIYAVPEEQLQRLRGNKRKRESRNGDSSALPEVLDQIEEVLLASQGLQEVSKSLKDLVAFVRGNKYTTVSLSEDQAAAVKAAFSCVICRDPMKDPMFASCCTTVLGCRACLDQWQDGHAHCPKCRTDDFSFHIQSVVGLDDALTALHNIIS
uniref:RING-type domain-containing protein n=1 Tax=Knipowitschia caucasica TaxID=637954 RepID=A0AAV2MPF7_KNICA